MDQSLLIDTIMKSIEFRQNLVILIFGVIGFALAKSWPDRVAHPEMKALKRLLLPILLGGASLALMLFEQWKLVNAISGNTFVDFSRYWLNFFGEPVLDLLIVGTALTLLFELRG